MNLINKSRLVSILIVTVGLIGSAEVRGQSREDTQKRLFAERLRRHGHISATKSAKSAEAAHAAHGEARAHHPARSAVDVSLAAPRATGPSLGLDAATPVVPSGNGVGRDAYMQSLYQDILGRDPSQSDLDYWTRALARGATTETIARALWNSPEHRSLVRNHEAPKISFAAAFRNANAAAHRANRRR